MREITAGESVYVTRKLMGPGQLTGFRVKIVAPSSGAALPAPAPPAPLGGVTAGKENGGSASTPGPLGRSISSIRL